MQSERLDKIIASQGMLSRKDASRYIREGKVMLNGAIVTNPNEKANPQSDEIIFDGKTLSYSKFTYIMMNKPKGIVCASTDKKVKTVVDLVPPLLFRNGLFPAGRLDKDTTGFVLITDDGDFAHNILSPKNHIEKTYEAVIESPISESDINILENGIILSDGTQLLPCKVKVLNNQKDLIEIKICEGKFHQIKKMLNFVDNNVLDLKRTKMGNLPLDLCLNEGKCRLITDDEKKHIS